MAMGPRLPDTSKPQHPLVTRRARGPGPADPNAPAPDRALLHLTMKPIAQLATTLAGKKHFNVEGLTDDIITLAANTLSAITDTWGEAVGHQTERKDRVQEREDTLLPELMEVVQLTSPTEQNIALKVTDLAVLERPRDTPTVTLTCHQHTCWVAKWDGTGTATRVQTCTPERQTATPLALEDHFKHSTHHTDHPLAHWVALQMAMHLPPWRCPPLQSRGQNQKSPTSGQGGYINPAAWGVPAISGPRAESEAAHKWGWWLHNPCGLGAPHPFRAGGRIRNGSEVGKVATYTRPPGGSAPLQRGGRNQRRPISGQPGYINPADLRSPIVSQPNVEAQVAHKCEGLATRSLPACRSPSLQSAGRNQRHPTSGRGCYRNHAALGFGTAEVEGNRIGGGPQVGKVAT